ncbi:MAG: hypothetical protein AN483_06460 [Aphanizomenon flos-aquae MDT14a]|jgi:hypothetical protein|nr:MAG: hypothetical protein AN483_06460 [Aphanizomenon flos-aquae MDT14a]
MTNEHLEKLREDVFQNILSQIEKSENGRLYKTIKIILGEDQQQTQKICRYLGIEDDADIDKDNKIIQDLVRFLGIPILDQDKILELGSKIVNCIDRKKNMELLIVAAFGLVGLSLYKQQYLDKKQQSKVNLTPLTEPPIQQPNIQSSSCAILHLIVPALIASKFNKLSNLTVDNVTDLIENAPYFLCTEEQEKELVETTDETIPSDSQTEVYIKIKINNGRNIIGEKIRYYLKTNLSEINRQYTLVEIACLKNLSGLENFNRII